MTIRAARFTPEVLLSAPRRSEGIPNSDASKVLYSVSTYSFEEHSKKSEIRILDVASQQTSLVTDDKTASEPTWIDDDNILLLKSGDDGVTTVLIGKADNFDNEYATGRRANGTPLTVFTATTPLARLKVRSAISRLAGLEMMRSPSPSLARQSPTVLSTTPRRQRNHTHQADSISRCL